MPHFFCKHLTDHDFDIDEWNAKYEKVKNFSEEVQRLTLDSPPACDTQCFDCMAIVVVRQAKTKALK